jgi:(p)ppGpp synthase/HD superfamily hydrolase
MPILTARFGDALQYAHEIHREQLRKDTQIPYISHLLSVAALTLEHGGDEDQAMGALLHDAAEDCGGVERLDDIRRRFGDVVAAIVEDCTDSWVEPKPKWRPRKEAYIASLETKPATALLVSLADKTHNARAIVADLGTVGDQLWERFSQGPDEVRWYYGSLAEVFNRRLPGPLALELRRSFEAMQD